MLKIASFDQISPDFYAQLLRHRPLTSPEPRVTIYLDMDKWLSGESSFKRVNPAQSENGTPVEEEKKMFESSSIEELRNRLSNQLKKKETKRSSLRNSLLFLAIFASVLAVATVFLLARVGILQGQNQNLNKEVEGLKGQIQSLELDNKNIQSKIDMAAKEREDLKGRIDTISRQKEALEQELRKNQTLIGNANEEKTYLEEILISKTKEIEQIKKSAPTPTANAVPQAVSLTTGSGDLQKLTQDLKDKDAEIQRLGEQNRILSNRIEKLYKVTNDKIAAINVAKITLDETIAEARKNLDSEWNTVDLGSIQAGSASQVVAPSTSTNPSKKEGHVLAINDQHGFIVVDLGKANGIDGNSILTLSQNGEKIATLTPLEVRDVMTACNIREIKPGKKIAVSDLVSIQK